jgi:hypothetical protein
MIRKTFVLLMILIFGPTAICSGEPRAWTDTTGKYRIQAEFKSLKDGIAILKKVDGTEIEVHVEKLSDADQQFIKEANRPTAILEVGDEKLEGRYVVIGIHGDPDSTKAIKIFKPKGFVQMAISMSFFNSHSRKDPRNFGVTLVNADENTIAEMVSDVEDFQSSDLRKNELQKGTDRQYSLERVEVDGRPALLVNYKLLEDGVTTEQGIDLYIEMPNKKVYRLIGRPNPGASVEDVERTLKAVLLSVNFSR